MDRPDFPTSLLDHGTGHDGGASGPVPDQLKPGTFCFTFEGHDEQCLSATQYWSERRVEDGTVFIKVEWEGFTARIHPDCCSRDPDVPITMVFAVEVPDGAQPPYQGRNFFLDYAYDFALRPYRCESRRGQEYCMEGPLTVITDVDLQELELALIQPHAVAGAAAAHHEVRGDLPSPCPFTECTFIRSGRLGVRFHLTF